MKEFEVFSKDLCGGKLDVEVVYGEVDVVGWVVGIWMSFFIDGMKISCGLENFKYESLF